MLRTAQILIQLGAAATVVFVGGCCHLAEPAHTPSGASPNQGLLDEMDTAHAWFFAKKTRPIWAKRLTEDQVVTTLEGKVTAKKGDFICRGEAGENWPQAAKTLEARYTPTQTVDEKGWRRYEPRPDAEGVMAAQVSHTFSVVATWGRLSGKAGDYVLKNRRDRDVAYPVDVWVVDRNLFAATYEAVKP